MRRDRVPGYSRAGEFRLSPLVFPSPVDLLVGLVALTIVGFSLLVGEPMPFFRDLGGRDSLSILPVSQFFRVADRVVSVSHILFLPAVAVVAVGVYMLRWDRSVRQHKPVGLPAEQAAYSRRVRHIARKMGLKSPPDILWTNSSRVRVPWVFWNGRHILIIPKLFNTKFGRYPRERDAILYHELAHVRNGDVWKTIVVQCLSVAYLTVATVYIGVQIAVTIPEWHWLASTMRLFMQRFVPLLISGGVLAYLNIVFLREREVRADITAAYYLKDALALRSALARSSMLASHPFHSLSFAGSNTVSRAISGVIRVHPSPALRNRYLFDSRYAFAPRTGLVFVAGLVSILAAEVIPRSLGFSMVGQGWAPFVSITLDYLAGLWSLSTFLIPLYVHAIDQAGSLRNRELNTTTFGYSLIWAAGAVLGALGLFPLMESLFFKFQSPWSFLTTYGAYAPWELALTLIFSRTAIRTMLTCPKVLRKLNASVRLMLVPLVVACVPVFILHITYMVWFDVIDMLGWRAYEFQMAAAVISIYAGTVFIGLGRLHRRYVGARRKARLPAPSANRPILFSQLTVLQNLFTHKWTTWVLLLVWVSAFLGVMELNKMDVERKQSLFEAARALPSQESPQGYVRYSDSELRASVVYPEGWFPHKFFEPDSVNSVEFLSPMNDRRLLLTTFPLSNALSPAELLALESLMVMGLEHDKGLLIEQSDPVSVSTAIGPAHGYSYTIDLESQGVSQNMLLSLDWNLGGTDYALTVQCYPEDRRECAEIFAQFVSSFEYVSPELSMINPSADSRVYLDARSQYAFRYPLEWKLLDISTSRRSHIDRELIIALPEDQTGQWTQVMLEPSDEDGSSSTITIKFSRFSQPVDTAERMYAWEMFNTHNPYFASYVTTARHQLEVEQLAALRRDFDVTDVEGDSISGSIVVFARDSDLWEIVVLCDVEEVPQCERALSMVLDTFQVDIATEDELSR